MDKLIIEQKKMKNRNDSFWYDGVIARIGKYSLIACGDIRILSSKSDFSCNGFKTFDETNEFEINLLEGTDKDLKRIGNGYDDDYYWDNNNWFEVVDKETGESIIGDVAYDYDEGIKLLKQYYKEKIYG